MDLDLLGLIHLGEHQDPGGRGVDAALGLGDGHPLHAVNPALVLQVRPHALGRIAGAALDGHLHVLVPAQVGLVGGDDLRLPPLRLGVAGVHAQQVGGEQRGLGPALPALDLEDDVAPVVGVPGDQQAAQALLGLGQPRLQLLELRGHLRVLLGHLPSGLDVLLQALHPAVGLDDPVQLGVAPSQLARLGLIRVHGRIGQLALQLLVLIEQGLDGFEHGFLGRIGGWVVGRVQYRTG
ncbi:Uncharacterised protein [Mycobacteroides abscessus subsp. abscessus]|nr:Uncharacterised protein [Mycobacteroides abscessus subsp. abscessus]